MALRTCTVTCDDVNGHQHSVEVTADSLYEAVAQALVLFRSNEWVGEVGQGTTFTVRVQPPVIEHRVRVNDFHRWLETNGRSPAEMMLKQRLRSILPK